MKNRIANLVRWPRWVAAIVVPLCGHGASTQVRPETGGAAATSSAAALLSPDELQFLGLHTHRLHSTGAPANQAKGPRPKRGLSTYTAQTDQAWTVMLHRRGLVPRETAAKVLRALAERASAKAGAATATTMTFDDSEGWLKTYFQKKGLDAEAAEDLASVVNYGRTRQEPMSRLLLRDRVLDVVDALLESLTVTLDVAEVHVETIMPGTTHMAHAQPVTYAAYLLACYDGLARGLEQLELAYRQTNQNTLGCGAIAGTGWPVDRRLVTELLGFDRLIEPTYGCEGAQDYGLTTMFALSNVAVLLTRSSIDHSIWGMDDCGLISLPGGLLQTSSLMPHKAHPGSPFEGIRTMASRVIGHMTTGVMANKAEPLTDVLPIYLAWTEAADAALEGEKALLRYNDLQRHVVPNKERMLQNVRDHFSCAGDLSIKLIREKGYGGRRAHRIAAVFVFMAKKQGLKPYETTGALLDEAARVAKEKPPGLSTAELHEIFDPVKFLERHNNVGDPNPPESRRMIGERRRELIASHEQQTQRKARLEAARVKLQAEVAAILRGTESSP